MDKVFKLTQDGTKALIYIGTNKAITTTYLWIALNYPELSGKTGIFTSLLSVIGFCFV